MQLARVDSDRHCPTLSTHVQIQGLYTAAQRTTQLQYGLPHELNSTRYSTNNSKPVTSETRSNRSVMANCLSKK